MRRIIAAVILLLSIALLFTRLGHYALWDDEAVTALAGRGVWRTGDTSVLLDHNVVAYRSGLLLRGTHERSTPPLGAYIAAPFVGWSDGEPWLARLPFALIAVGSVGLILFWLYTMNASWLTWILVGIALIGNVSFWLYNRQCRYYSPVIFSSIAVAYLYLNWNGSRWQLALLAAASIMLLAGNYLNYLALQLCMLLDYAMEGRKRRMLKVTDWLIVLVPQIVIGGVIVTIWNTLGTGNKEYLEGNSFLHRLQLVWMNLRDINACEYGVGLMVLAAPVLFIFRRRQAWFWRAPLALLIYVVVVSILSPQILTGAPTVADVRYLAPVIPLCIAIGVLVILELSRVHAALAIGAAILAFATNLLNGAWIYDSDSTPARSTLISFLGELSNPPTDPYEHTIDWIEKNVLPGESIWVQPAYATYPLMFHAPQPVYAWQIDPNRPLPEGLQNLPPIHFVGRQIPDFFIAVGPVYDEPLTAFRKAGINFQAVYIDDVFPLQSYRPELFWHRFTAQPADRNSGLAVYIFRQVVSPLNIR